MLCWKTGTGIVTVAGVGAAVGVGATPSPLAGEGRGGRSVAEDEGDLSTADAAVLVSTAPASAIPPAVRNCRLVATADRM
jgi:hypothetical protein